MAYRLLMTFALGAALAGAAAERAHAQSACEQEFLAIRKEMEAKGKTLQAASKRKAQAPEVCSLMRIFADAEGKAVKYLRTNQRACNIPEQMVKQAQDSHAKTLGFRTKVCNAAANGAGAPPPPSQGLSGALGSNTGGTPTVTPGGSGVFDTLNGSILRQ
jgi:hypothetical protein